MINIVTIIRQEKKQRCMLFNFGMPFQVRFDLPLNFNKQSFEVMNCIVIPLIGLFILFHSNGREVVNLSVLEHICFILF